MLQSATIQRRLLRTLSAIALLCIASNQAMVFASENGEASTDSAVSTPSTNNRVHVQQVPGGILASENGTPILRYQRQDKSIDGTYTRAHYVHPLYSLDGKILTEDFPSDHRHHRGVFWSWHQLLINGQSIGDGWLTKRFRWDVKSVEYQEHPDGAVQIDCRVEWKSPDWKNGNQPVVTEHCSIKIFPKTNDHRFIDFDIRFRANQPKTLIGGSDDSKGYGGFSVRIALPKDIQFMTTRGAEQPTTNAIASSPWLQMSGNLGTTTTNDDSSQPDSADHGHNGITVLNHPKSIGFPQPWIIRSKRSMQNAVWPGPTPQNLPHDSETRLRYRLVVHRDKQTPQTINSWHQAYSALP